MATSKAGVLRISKEAEAILRSDPEYEKLARENVEEYARRLRRLDELTRKSTISDAQAVALGREIRRGAYKRFKARK